MVVLYYCYVNGRTTSPRFSIKLSECASVPSNAKGVIDNTNRAYMNNQNIPSPARYSIERERERDNINIGYAVAQLYITVHYIIYYFVYTYCRYAINIIIIAAIMA